jgi:hypothetical protein
MAKKQTAQKAKVSKAVKQEKPAESIEFKPGPVAGYTGNKPVKEPKPVKESLSRFSDMPAKLDALKDELIQLHKDNEKDKAIERIHNFALFLWRLRHQLTVGSCVWNEQ